MTATCAVCDSDTRVRPAEDHDVELCIVHADKEGDLVQCPTCDSWTCVPWKCHGCGKSRPFGTDDGAGTGGPR